MDFYKKKYYEIVQDDLYVKELTSISGHFRRMDELDNAICWALTRNPRLPEATLIQPPNGYVIKVNPNSGTLPTVDVIYEVDDEKEQVVLIDIWEVEDEES